jgi:phospholipid-translocating ATPase
MALSFSTFEENDDATIPTPKNVTKRLRWATQYKKGKSGNRKRMSILDRLHHRGSQNTEKNRDSGGSMATDLGPVPEEPEDEGEEDLEEDRDGQGPRKIYFNLPLPPDAVDENGHPLKHYRRNKIRTAKYTPISFVPKNLWYQFHNIANVYFLFLIILAVSDVFLLQHTWLIERTDFQHLWSLKPGPECGSFDRHRLHYCSEGCHRRLP